MAPEIRNGLPSEFGSDIFSFAMTAVYILTGKEPKLPDASGQVMRAVDRYSADFAEKAELSQLLQQCASYDPPKPVNEVRPSAKEVIRSLVRVLGSNGGDPRLTVDDQIEVIDRFEQIAKRMQRQRRFGATSTAASSESAKKIDSWDSRDTSTEELDSSYDSVFTRPSLVARTNSGVKDAEIQQLRDALESARVEAEASKVCLEQRFINP